MVRCDEFYEKWEKCGNFCEKHPQTAQEINKYLDFIREIENREDIEPEVKSAMADLPERAVRPLIREKDPEIKENVIQSVRKSLKSGKDPLSGKFTKKTPHKKEEIPDVHLNDIKETPSPKQERKSKPKKTPKITTRTIERMVRKEKAKKQVTKPKPAIPVNEFNVIYADPPWQYNKGTATPNRKIENQYLTMELKDIKNVNFNSAKDSVLFLWATAPLLLEALEVLESWGFKYKTQAVWDKKKMGMGYWFRGQHEILLIGVKGDIKPPEPSNRFSSVIESKRQGHSQKPDCVYDMIEKMFPEGKYLELFARDKRDNWTVWGNQL